MNKPRLVMIGNGMAGVRTLEELLKLAPDRYDITVFGAEPHPNYNRVLLSPVLAGEQTFDDIVLNPLSWYAQHGITLHLGQTVVDVDRQARRVTTQTGLSVTYDQLIIATGSVPFILPVPGCDLEGVLGYRDIADTQAMIDITRTHQRAVVIGGGVLGLEAANGLRQRGMEVAVVHIGHWLMERQLDETAGQLLRESLEARGLQFHLRGHTQALLGDASGRVRAVQLADGTDIPADLVVMAAGIRPNTALAEKMGLTCQRGIVVSDHLQTSDPAIWAVGECANHRGTVYGLVAPLFEQATVLAAHLAGQGEGVAYTGSTTSAKLKVTGIELFSAGDFMGSAHTQDIVLSDPLDRVYKKLVLNGDTLVGACLYGDAQDGNWYFQLIRASQPIGHLRHELMFGQPEPVIEAHQT